VKSVRRCAPLTIIASVSASTLKFVHHETFSLNVELVLVHFIVFYDMVVSVQHIASCSYIRITSVPCFQDRWR